MTEENVFLACPTHNGQLDYRTARSIYQTASKDRGMMIYVQQSSLLANCCNQMYCKALNMREQHKIGWFAMIHADVVPEHFWLDKMIAIAEERDADILSAIIPIKDHRGVTSTAISRPHSNSIRDRPDYPHGKGPYTRLTMKQVKALPQTFDIGLLKEHITSKVLPDLRIRIVGDHHQLLVNTGLMICRLYRPWNFNTHFEIRDTISRKYGQFYAEVESEDWVFSSLAASEGAKVMATSAVSVQHIGASSYRSNAVWGENIDPDCLMLNPTLAAK